MQKFTFKLYPDDTLCEYIPLTHSVKEETGDIRDCDEKILEWAQKKGFAIERINHTSKTILLTAPFAGEYDTTH